MTLRSFFGCPLHFKLAHGNIPKLGTGLDPLQGACPFAADEFSAQKAEASGGACGWEPRMHPRACGKILVVGKMQATPDVEGRNYAINAPYII